MNIRGGCQWVCCSTLTIGQQALCLADIFVKTGCCPSQPAIPNRIFHPIIFLTAMGAGQRVLNEMSFPSALACLTICWYSSGNDLRGTRNPSTITISAIGLLL
jgi:hypothetical protein